MDSNMIPMLQMGIGFVVFIMVLLVLLYIYLMRPKKIEKTREASEDALLTGEGDNKKNNIQNLLLLLQKKMLFSVFLQNYLFFQYTYQ